MNEFVWNKKEHTYFQKDNLNGWCVCEGITICGTKTEYQVSDGDVGERTISYDFLFLLNS